MCMGYMFTGVDYILWVVFDSSTKEPKPSHDKIKQKRLNFVK